jgi:acetolactate synthase-1/2/3 large subunit
MNVAEWITQELINRGVTHVFTLQGGYSMYLNDAIGHSSLKPVYMLTESGAAYAAYGYAQYSGRMGVCVVTSGLAQTNALSGVASAYSDYLPMMVISGDVRNEFLVKRDTEGLRQGWQQDVPIERIANSITKSVYTIRKASMVEFWFDRAWKQAITEPKAPVWLDVPIDVQQEML